MAFQQPHKHTLGWIIYRHSVVIWHFCVLFVETLLNSTCGLFAYSTSLSRRDTRDSDLFLWKLHKICVANTSRLLCLKWSQGDMIWSEGSKTQSIHVCVINIKSSLCLHLHHLSWHPNECHLHINRKLPLTCVLSKLVHGLQVNDVRRELSIHLPQDHSPPSVPFQYVLDVVADSRTVGPPSPVFIQPLPDHHPGQVLRWVPQPIDGHQQPRSWTSHLLCCDWACPWLKQHCNPVSQLTHWSMLFSAK